MKKILLIAAVAVLLLSCNSRSGHRKEVKEAQTTIDEKIRHNIWKREHNIVIRFSGKDSEIPKDGELLVIKCSLEDTIIVDIASDDDCRRILESHGKG